MLPDYPDLIRSDDPEAYSLPLPEGQPQSANSGGLVNSLLVLSGQGRCYGLQGYSNKASAQFILIFDGNTLPADTAVPLFGFAVGAGAGATTGNFSLYFGTAGRWFQRGIVLCNSSTLATKTIGSADTWFDVQFTPQIATQ